MATSNKTLVIVTDYPQKDGKVAHQFVHVRNLFYKKNGINVTVLNFSTKENYEYEGIKVISLKYYKENQSDYNVLISHQPNIRNHYFFIKKYGENFKEFVLFFHGHEVLKINTVYPEPYDFVKINILKFVFQNFYDNFKLFIWRMYIPQIINKTKLIFVSKWMLEEFLKWTRIPYEQISDKCRITYNCVAQQFENEEYIWENNKEYDFVTIRSNLDGSKYCIDIVNEIAKNNPKYSFLVIGKGEFFKHYKKADNIIWQDRFLNHAEIVEILQKARCALMPTRTDAQGLMMCEMATFGIPVITSDIPVCHEVFEDFKNVKLINNDVADVSIDEYYLELIKNRTCIKNKKYFNENTSADEIEYIYK